ncbi:N-acetyltransferase [Cellulomonas sp. WB94]|uniref:GNAT family N-acetyltransferase n=1 Tax=Cellulomonas sp. WB94 TaxID=2173174 RepID=UPI000D580353|nr:GNAT family N-acetyltransferase [Cellulomonas sp. WB94]PVU83689.1 N-acetyltransferase [Cellulomonas sp. WB94]
MSEIEVRVAQSDAEVTAAGALTAEAYHADRLIDDGDEYRAELLDARRRADEATLLVAVLTPEPGHDAVVVGTVTLAPVGTSYAEIAEPGEVEIRMLAVAPEARRRGVAEALVRACLREAVVLGAQRVVLSTLEAMVTAHRLYERLGFVRVPERDWHHEEIVLHVLTWTVPEAPGATVETATWRPLVVHDVAGWQAGASGGFTRRANSVVATDEPEDVAARIAEVEDLYARAGRPSIFRIGRESRPAGLGTILGARGYDRVSGAIVMVRTDLAALADAPVDASGSSLVTVRAADEPDDDWVRCWLDVKAGGSAPDRSTAVAILAGSPALYLTAYAPTDPSGSDPDGEPVGVIRAAFADDWVALACLVVAGHARRRGVAQTLTRAAVRAATARGARRAFLQVEHANAGAIALYEALGFSPAESYDYVARPVRKLAGAVLG